MPTNTHIVLREGTVSISSSAFSSSNLISVTIPESVSRIDGDAFSSSSLTSVRVNSSTPASIEWSTFRNSANAKLYVPYGSKATYEVASHWKNFKEILESTVIDMSSNEICTFSSNYALDFSGVSGLKAYIVSGFSPSTGTLVLTPVTEVPAGTGLLLKGAEGSYEVPYTTTDMYYTNLLTGVTTTTEISPTAGDQTNFILADGAHGINFYTLSEAGDLAAGKAYLHLPTTAVAAMSRPFKLVFDDETTGMTTGIDGISENEKADGTYYDLQGRRIAQPAKGLYIVNGKKVFIK